MDIIKQKRPSPLKGRPSPLKGRIKPHVWITGPDPLRKKLYRKFELMKCQANYRRLHNLGTENQQWSCTFEQFELFVKGKEHLLGNKRGQLRIRMKDKTIGWHVDNMFLA